MQFAVIQAPKEKTDVPEKVQTTKITAAEQTFHTYNLIHQFAVIGHVPKLMAMWLTKFVKRPSNSGKAIIKGKRVTEAVAMV